MFKSKLLELASAFELDMMHQKGYGTIMTDEKTPFERLKAAMTTVLSVPKSSLPKAKKKPRKK